MFKYEQSTGKLFNPDGVLLGTGWAGNGLGKNNPDMQDVKGVGPVPQGIYMFGKPYDSAHTGSFSIPLVPNPNNEMFGRSMFMMHGGMSGVDEQGFVTINGKKQPVSEGCIIMPRNIRELVNESRDRLLQVVK